MANPPYISQFYSEIDRREINLPKARLSRWGGKLEMSILCSLAQDQKPDRMDTKTESGRKKLIRTEVATFSVRCRLKY